MNARFATDLVSRIGDAKVVEIKAAVASTLAEIVVVYILVKNHVVNLELECI